MPTILDRAVERIPLDGHDGKSGGRLERVVLDDGTRLVVKRVSPDWDFTMTATGDDVGREHRLREAGVLDRLPAGVDHPLIDSWRADDHTVLVMRDLGDAVVGWGRRISREECRRLLGAATALHDAFAGAAPIDGLCSTECRIGILSPQATEPFLGRLELADAVARGWERFGEIVDDDVVAAVARLQVEPRRVVGRFDPDRFTLLHGDLWLVNVAFEDDRVTLLDWAIATWGPPVVDFASFLVGCSSQVDASRDDIVEDFSAASTLTTADDLARGLVGGLLELGWNKALDATEHDDADKRAQERADLDWWIDRARRAFDAGLVDL